MPLRTLAASLALMCAAIAPSVAWAQAPSLAEILEQSPASDWRALDPENTIYMDLPAGRVVIELAPEFAPNHVANIRALARSRFFDGAAIVRSQDNYVVQWGRDEGDQTPQGRLITCEHLTRRVVRYEHDGGVTVLADSYNGKRLNSPNDVVPHPDGSYWFTDPPYGGMLYEGAADAPGGPTNLSGRLRSQVGQAAGIGLAKRELPTNCYRIDPSGRVDLVITEAQVPDPNGLVFSPDYKKLYVVSTGKGPGDTGPGGKGDMHVFDVGSDNKLYNQKLFTDFMIDGVKCGPDGVRCDVDGNLANATTLDWNGDGRADVAGYDSGRRELRAWILDGARILERRTLAPGPVASLRALDLDGDEREDLVVGAPDGSTSALLAR